MIAKAKVQQQLTYIPIFVYLNSYPLQIHNEVYCMHVYSFTKIVPCQGNN